MQCKMNITAYGQGPVPNSSMVVLFSVIISIKKCSNAVMVGDLQEIEHQGISS